MVQQWQISGTRILADWIMAVIWLSHGCQAVTRREWMAYPFLGVYPRCLRRDILDLDYHSSVSL